MSHDESFFKWFLGASLLPPFFVFSEAKLQADEEEADAERHNLWPWITHFDTDKPKFWAVLEHAINLIR